MNYTRPNSIDHTDKPEDWLNSALLFASALGHILKETEGVVVDIAGDVQMDNLLERGCIKVFIHASKHKIHITECWDDIPEGTMVWMHESEWLRQYLEDEKLWYITEHHPEDGILGEHFFEKGDEDKMNEFIEENNIIFKNE